MTFMPRAPSGGGPTDAELLRRAVAGDHAAFGDLFDRHAHSIYNFCLRRSGDRTAAEDLVSATFLHAWRRRADVVLDDDSLLPWLYGVAANLTRRHLRGARRYDQAVRSFGDRAQRRVDQCGKSDGNPAVRPSGALQPRTVFCKDVDH